MSRIVTKNIRSASERWAIEMIDSRGLPSAVYSSRATSSGSPSIQPAKPGEASRLLSRIASSSPLLGRVERLHVDHADALDRRLSGSAGSGRPCRGRGPAARPCRASCESRMCSRLRIGSASMPTSASSPDDGRRDPLAEQSASSSIACGGAANDRSTVIGSPALRARRVDGQVDRRRESVGDSLGRLRPSRPVPRASGAAVCCGQFVGRDALAGRFGLRRSRGESRSGRSSGNASSRLPRSPLGSMAMAGTPSMAASSSSARHKPVLPLPVMPTQTACVVRSLAS